MQLLKNMYKRGEHVFSHAIFPVLNSHSLIRKMRFIELIFVQAACAQRAFVSDGVDPGQFRHQASLRASGKHFCSGAIIGARYALSLAQCDINNLYKVYSGSNSNNGGIGRNVERATKHPYYSPSRPSYGKKVTRKNTRNVLHFC